MMVKKLCNLLNTNIIAGKNYSNQKGNTFYTSDITTGNLPDNNTLKYAGNEKIINKNKDYNG